MIKPFKGKVKVKKKTIDVDCDQIVATGEPPIIVRNIRGTVISSGVTITILLTLELPESS